MQDEAQSKLLETGARLQATEGLSQKNQELRERLETSEQRVAELTRARAEGWKLVDTLRAQIGEADRKRARADETATATTASATGCSNCPKS